MERKDIEQVLTEAAEVFADLEGQDPLYESVEDQVALLQYALDEALGGLDELEVVDPEGYEREIVWIEDLEQALEGLEG